MRTSSLLVALLAGCYSGTPAATSSPSPPSEPQATPAAPVKPSLTAYSLRDGAVVAIDLERETIERVASSGRLDADVSSLAHIDDKLIACGEDDAAGKLFVISLTSTAVFTHDRECDAVASDGRWIWLQLPMRATLAIYDGLDALLADRPTRQVPAPRTSSRLGMGTDRVLASWHSADSVFLIDPTHGATTTLRLDRYDGWIFGLAAAGRDLFVVGGWAEKGIRAFDIQTGKLRRTLFPDAELQGLTMPTRPASP